MESKTKLTKFQKRDLVYMCYSLGWSMFPRCPLKRVKTDESNGFQLGCLLAEHKSIVYLANIFDPITPNTEKIVYESYEKLLIDGWMVD